MPDAGHLPPSGEAEDFVLTFPPEEALFVFQRYSAATAILEYGSGGSTVLAAQLGKPVVAVESDAAWAARLADRLEREGLAASLHPVDIGPTGDWGRPRSTEGAARYHRYALSVWDRPDLRHPDLVLIDGRFRAACLAATMLRISRPVTVLFDDYLNRPFYHGVEKLVRRAETVGRMARFEVEPGPIPPDLLTEVIGWFADPR